MAEEGKEKTGVFTQTPIDATTADVWEMELAKNTPNSDTEYFAADGGVIAQERVSRAENFFQKLLNKFRNQPQQPPHK